MVNSRFFDTEISTEEIDKINYKDTKLLVKFISDQGKILPRRVTGLNSKQQKRITKLIKRARIAALLPFVIGKS
jgi:small subunit ribosomal protein S18